MPLAPHHGSHAMTRPFVPAAGHDLFLPLYDPLWRLMGGRDVRATFIRNAKLAAGQRVLDVGCGTGSLAVQIAETVPGTIVHALDPDPKALARAGSKATRAQVSVAWKEGFGDALPYADESFERVTSSFMFHHLDRAVKQGMLREARRVLTRGGEFHLVDFGGHDAEHDHQRGLLARLLHAKELLADQPGSGVVDLFEEAGFTNVARVSAARSLFGHYAHIRGAA